MTKASDLVRKIAEKAKALAAWWFGDFPTYKLNNSVEYQIFSDSGWVSPNTPRMSNCMVLPSTDIRRHKLHAPQDTQGEVFSVQYLFASTLLHVQT